MHTAPCPQDLAALLSAVVRVLLLQEGSEAGGAPLLCWEGGNQRSSYFYPLRLAPEAGVQRALGAGQPGAAPVQHRQQRAERFRSLHMDSAVTGS